MKTLLLVLALCGAQIHALSAGPRPDYNDDYDQDIRNDWQPEPLKPASWQSEPRYAQPAEAVVQVPEIGQILGVGGYKTIANRPVNAFLGIRYGTVGGGLARFQAAQPIGYQGRVNATVQSPNCAQFPELDRLRVSESRGENVDDCLTLDIYAPEGANHLPVLVFVHGEMLFDGGSEEAQPDYVLEKDVLLVSINYRLAPFGFLSALTDELPGNVALSDLHLALEWLQRHLVHFGGNPGQVTLVGQAGGATLAHALSLSGRAGNLFQQLILQSGTALNPYLIDNQPLDTLSTFARLARCPPPPINAIPQGFKPLYECLGRLPTSQLVAAFEQLLLQNEQLGLTQLGGFKLVVGDPLGFLPSHPASLVTNSSLALPMIVGATKDASAFILSRIYDQIARLQSRNVSDYIDVVLRHTAPPSEHRLWKQWALREIFTPIQEHTASVQTVASGLLELSNYILYRAPVINSIRQSYRSTPAYLYTFDYRGEHHRFGHLSNPLPFGIDASLSDDSVYLFPYPPEASRLNPSDRSVSRALVTMWVNFASTGVPNPNSGVWPQATSEYGPFLRFTNNQQSPIELDPNFGEGIYLPNHSWVSYKPTTIVSPPITTTTTTTTTTTSRPYAYNPYANWQNRPALQNPNWHPADPEYVRAQEARQQEFIREREQRRREQQQREQRRRPQQESREQQEVRLRQQREQEERIRQQREEEERLHQQREQEDRIRQQQEREQYEREQQEREQREREERQREEQEREQQEREQRQFDHNPEPEPGYPEDDQQPDNNPDDGRLPYPSYEQYGTEENGNLPESDPNRNYSEEDREQQLQEQLRREQHEQQEREYQLQREREQREREQREREQQEHGLPELGPEEYPSYEEYIKALQEKNAESDRVYAEEQERERQHQDTLLQENQQQPHEVLPEETPTHPNYEAYDPERSYIEEQEREQQRRDQVEQERNQQEQERDQGEEYERSPDEEEAAEHDVLKVEDFPSYEAYLEAATKLREEQEKQEKLEEELYRAQQEEEDRIHAERERNSHN
ncbi:glutactin [Drosophila teissieri]|uniref:glutactin n=1 Tax=Drosophila teissieri TaxID=7243 RepID=UPI001CB9DC86|nr:glutactin [Drosophila teissieri]